ncbi:MAG: pyridoxal-phosphate dependent enzyme [Deltaproteobacteria bacterium]|nr:MAG: pyridoxal-phosphate dependent enzyme [Deltaproteobacteria bacterium]
MRVAPPGLNRPWLFEVFPRLRQKLPWTPLVDAPTRVHRLENVSAQLDREVWIKRDDKSASEYGGNKPRKLEFILSEALDQGRNRVVTGGGLGTNHGLATAIFGKKLGFRVTLGLFDQPVTAHVRKNLLLYQANGAEMIYMGSMLKAALRYYVIERVRRRDAFFIVVGGSSPLGVLGFVDAGLEFAIQVQRKEIPLPKVIFVAAGTCGTMAGLVLGLRLAGLRTRVLGVQVAPGFVANPKAMIRLARKALKVMRRLDRSVPEVRLTLADFPMERGHYGPGYGHPTRVCRQAIQFMAESEAIFLDPTYTGKTFGALMEYGKSETQGPVLFWNTLNSVDLSSVAESVDYRSLPEAFHRFFESDLVE